VGISVQQDWRNKTKSQPYKDSVAFRATLPIFNYRDEILSAIKRQKSQVTIISAETGAGKTTQVGQYILENALHNNENVNALCTQPRRIAASSVAERVSKEMVEVDGSGGGGKVSERRNR